MLGDETEPTLTIPMSLFVSLHPEYHNRDKVLPDPFVSRRMVGSEQLESSFKALKVQLTILSIRGNKNRCDARDLPAWRPAQQRPPEQCLGQLNELGDHVQPVFTSSDRAA